MKRYILPVVMVCLIGVLTLSTFAGCGGGGGKDAGVPLAVEEVDPNNPDGGDSSGDTGQIIPGTSIDGLHPIFRGELGTPIATSSLYQVGDDPTGFDILNDFDGDGIPNDQEITTNPFVADYPRIVTRISAPITMEIRVSETTAIDNHVETLEEDNMKDTIVNSMEDKQYAQMNKKTTPYVTKESYSDSGSHSEAYGYESSFSASGKTDAFFCELDMSISGSEKRNWSFADSFAMSTMSEKTVFEDVDYMDNLDRNGKEFKDETVKNIVKNYRNNVSLKTNQSIGPNAGIVRTSLFIKNLSVNMPVKVSNIVCTLSFRTPAGEFLPVKSFRLRSDDWGIYEQEIYGGEEFGPYTIEIDGLNTNEIKKALANGYVPQIHVVSYDMNRVADSNYNPGVDNLKIVEETAKARTATIVVVGKNTRDIYRVCAFDTDSDGHVSPGVSLKKALFNIYQNRIGRGENWETDANAKGLTVADAGLKWKADSVDPANYVFTGNAEGNSWNKFETYVKSYRDAEGQVHYIETIKRIGELVKYNPFDVADNPGYNPNELLTEAEVLKTKYWVIYHNGRYYTGDINDPVWAGERYEIICFDADDFQKHLANFSFTPLQSLEPVYLETRWNKLTNKGEFARSRYLGKILKGDVVHLEVDLLEYYSLFDKEVINELTGMPHAMTDYDANAWYDFHYTFQPADELQQGIPKDFSHTAAGGTNNLKVKIDESQYAHNYEISFRVDGSTDAWRVVKVSKTLYDQEKGYVYINSKTLDSGGVPVGYIPGDVYYQVRVKALGICYNVSVSKNSLANGTVRTYVYNAQSGIMPGGFTYNAISTTNKIQVLISSAGNTEYFLIKLKGPFNYAGCETNERVYRGHAGLNVLDVPNPASVVFDPGVYLLEVYGVNQNCLAAGVEDPNLITAAQNGEQNILVTHERYADQKGAAFKPKLSPALMDLRAVDMEVNFNDGSGWHPLRVSIDGVDRNYIDCRYSSYIDYDKRKFHIFFRPPSDAGYDVFMGGREEADLYLRTVAKPKYRDTFWLKPLGQIDFAQATRYILASLGISDFITYWIKSDWSDATQLESTVAAKDFTGGTVGSDDFSLFDVGISDYFFSPMEHKVFKVKAEITDTIATVTGHTLEKPTFNVTAGSKCIIVDQMNSRLADNFEVYWKPGRTVGTEDMEAYPWNRVQSVTVNSDGGYYKIDGLTPNENYIVAVRAFNSYGTSEFQFYGDTPEDGLQLQPVTVYSNDPPAAPEHIWLNVGDDGKSIIVNNIHVDKEYRYEVYWKTEAEEDVPAKWQKVVLDKATSGTVLVDADFKPKTYPIVNLNFWERYHIKVRALSGSGTPGAFSEEKVIATRTPTGDDQFQILVGWHNCGEYFGSFAVNSIVLPAGTKQYRISYSLQYDHCPDIMSGNINHINASFKSTGWLDVSNRYTVLYGDSNFLNASYTSSTEMRDIYYQLVSNCIISFTVACKNEYGEIVERSFLSIGTPNWGAVTVP